MGRAIKLHRPSGVMQKLCGSYAEVAVLCSLGTPLAIVANVAAAASVLRFVAGCALSGLYIVRGCRVGFWCLVESIAPRRGYPNYRIFRFSKITLDGFAPAISALVVFFTCKILW